MRKSAEVEEVLFFKMPPRYRNDLVHWFSESSLAEKLKNGLIYSAEKYDQDVVVVMNEVLNEK